MVLILRSLLNPAPILILDEPTSALDEQSTDIVKKMITSLREIGDKTIIIVTHDRQLLNLFDNTFEMSS